jgi:hypothetical protein
VSTLWCPQCGAEYRDGVTTCTDCGVPLGETPPPDDTSLGSDVIVYELDEWSADQRGALEQRLVAEDIQHQWETQEGADVHESYEPGDPWAVGTDLVVGEQDEDVVDAILDELEAGGGNDALQAVADDGTDDEASYAVMSGLYVAADRLKDDPDDLALAGEFFDAADAARTTPAPFGIDGEVWRRVQELAGEVARSLEQEEDDEVVAANAQRLRDVLFGYV